MSFECSVCKFPYDGKLRKPLILSCGHSFCQMCLLEMENKRCKLCPICYTPWIHTAVASLTVCHQILSKKPLVAKSALADCVQHTPSLLSTWCNSCNESACVKCIKEQHNECDWVPIDEKKTLLSYRYSKCLQEVQLKIKKFEIYAITRMTDNVKLKEDLSNHSEIIKKIVDEIKETKQQLTSMNLDLTRDSVEILKEKVFNANALLNKCQQPNHPGALLFHMATAYQKCTTDDPDNFVTNFRISVDDGVTYEMEYDLIDQVSPVKTKEGIEWEITSKRIANSALRTLKGTSIRPLKIIIRTIKPECALNSFLSEVIQYNVKIDFFPTDIFYANSDVSYVTNTARMEYILKNPDRFLGYWGVMDSAALTKLPSTLTTVGLLVKTVDDLEPAKTLYNLSNVIEMHLCVMKTFVLGAWDTSLKICRIINPRLSLHLPQLHNSNDLKWAQQFIEKITAFFHIRLHKLYLPDIRGLTADAILGKLRDWNLHIEVHLPAYLTMDCERYCITGKYEEQHCSVMWDL